MEYCVFLHLLLHNYLLNIDHCMLPSEIETFPTYIIFLRKCSLYFTEDRYISRENATIERLSKIIYSFLEVTVIRFLEVFLRK